MALRRNLFHVVGTSLDMEVNSPGVNSPSNFTIDLGNRFLMPVDGQAGIGLSSISIPKSVLLSPSSLPQEAKVVIHMDFRCTLKVYLLLKIIYQNYDLVVTSQDQRYTDAVAEECNAIFTEIVDVIRTEMIGLEGEQINEYRMQFVQHLMFILNEERRRNVVEYRNFGRRRFWDIMNDENTFLAWIGLGSIGMLETVALLQRVQKFDFDFDQTITIQLPYLKRREFMDASIIRQVMELKANFARFNLDLVSKTILGPLGGLTVTESLVPARAAGDGAADDVDGGDDNDGAPGRKRTRGQAAAVAEEKEPSYKFHYQWKIRTNVSLMTLSSSPEFFDFISFYGFRAIWRRDQDHTFIFDSSGQTPNSFRKREFKLVKSLTSDNVKRFYLKDEIPPCIFLECPQVIKKSVAGSQRSIVKTLIVNHDKMSDESRFIHFRSRHIEYVPLAFCDHSCIDLKLTDIYGRELKGNSLPYVRNVIEQEKKLKPGQCTVPITIVQMNVIRRM